MSDDVPKSQCCYRHGGVTPCANPAAWRIYERGTTAEWRDDSFTESCNAHVGDLLSHAGEPKAGQVVHYTVYQI